MCNADAYLEERDAFEALHAAFLSHDDLMIRLAIVRWTRAQEALRRAC
jgi:hypothetical protein